MPRAPRILIEGGLYHVYNRFARGEEVFAESEEAIEFLDLLRELKKRDGLQVFAWSLLSKHFHLAVRTFAVPLSRTMRTLQGGYSKAFNQRWRRTGPLWQSRYQTRLVNDQQYIGQLIIYIHLNPVRSGLVEDPMNHVFSGHREMLGNVLGKPPDVVSRWARKGAERRLSDPEFAEAIDQLDSFLAGPFPTIPNDQ
ncbi:MAG: transposase [Thermoanaerobaculales bacterium]|nr:transposase [Thermoanaerobaculales bacterium]